MCSIFTCCQGRTYIDHYEFVTGQPVSVCIRPMKVYKLQRSGEKSRNITFLQRGRAYSVYNKTKDGKMDWLNLA